MKLKGFHEVGLMSLVFDICFILSYIYKGSIGSYYITVSVIPMLIILIVVIFLNALEQSYIMIKRLLYGKKNAEKHVDKC
jgi:hypothetical protein